MIKICPNQISFQDKNSHVGNEKAVFISFFKQFSASVFAHGCDVISMSLVGSPMALTHSILISLFIKLKLNNFLLPPLLSIVVVQEHSVVFRKVFDEGRLQRRTFLPEKWRAWVQVCRVHFNKD